MLRILSYDHNNPDLNSHNGTIWWEYCYRKNIEKRYSYILFLIFALIFTLQYLHYMCNNTIFIKIKFINVKNQYALYCKTIN